MPGQQWRTHTETGRVQVMGKKAECLRCVPKAMQEENSVRALPLQVDSFGTGDYSAGDVAPECMRYGEIAIDSLAIGDVSSPAP